MVVVINIVVTSIIIIVCFKVKFIIIRHRENVMLGSTVVIIYLKTTITTNSDQRITMIGFITISKGNSLYHILFCVL